MFFDFLNILALLTIFTGVICLVDIIMRRRQGVSSKIKHPLVIEYARAFFPILLIVLLIRAFLVQPYRVPTGSLEPTVVPGDMILVNQFDYGFYVPLWNKKIISVGEPKVGQIALFRWPVSPSVTFIKRVIGVPGDRISYVNKVLSINGKEAKQTFIKDTTEIGDDGKPTQPVKEYEENLNGIKHKIIVNPSVPAENFKNLLVPKGKYFMMGDNRDDSGDSRYWGFVPADAFVGKGLFIWMSWDPNPDAKWSQKVRWHRIGMGL